MDKKLNLILCSSAHLPSGTGEAEFEALYSNDIKPLVSALDKFPRINMVFHYSGVLLHWIERRYPELFMLLEDLLSRKQAEFLGGGFYDPMLPLLPSSDKIGQIEMLTTYLRKQFGKRPQGCWLPAMVWEQSLVGPLTSSGMSYTFLEDKQFSGAGVKPGKDGIFSPCLTEDQGKLITVFPVAASMGMELRTGSPQKILGELLEKLLPEENKVLVLPVGGEASSPLEPPSPLEPSSPLEPLPPYEKFFEELSQADPRIDFSTAAKVVKNLRSLKKVYFPGASAADDAGTCRRGSPEPRIPSGNRTNPRQFMAENPEAGGIYSKMIYVHTLINNQLRGDKTRKRTALEELWKAQDSGVFRLGVPLSPGLIHSPVRKAAYRALLEAEKICREKTKFTPSLSVFDLDLDGEGEYIFQDDKINCYMKSRGAGIFELDYLPAGWNYLDTMAGNNPEPAAVSDHLISGQRGSPPERRGKACAFIDRLLPAEALSADALPGNSAEAENRGYPPEEASETRYCGAEEYEAAETDRVRRRATFRLPPKTGVPWGAIEIEKTVQLKKNSLALEYVLRNTGTASQNFVFSSAADLSFPGETEGFLRIFSHREGDKEGVTFNDSIAVRNIRALEFQDIKNEAVITLELSRSFDARIFHVRAGFTGREEYQSTRIMPLLPVFLEAGKAWKAAFSLKISP